MNTSLAITISPKHRTHGTLYVNPQRHLYLDDRMIIAFYLKKSNITRYIIFPEFDEKGRLHYHGVLTLNHHQFVTFYKQTYFKLSRLGFVDVKQMSTFEDKFRWSIYMKKNWGITKDILEIDVPIIKHQIIPTPRKKKTINADIISEGRSLNCSLFDYFAVEKTVKNI